MHQYIGETLRMMCYLGLSDAVVTDINNVIIYFLVSAPPEYDLIKASIENPHNGNLTLYFAMQRLVNAKP